MPPDVRVPAFIVKLSKPSESHQEKATRYLDEANSSSVLYRFFPLFRREINEAFSISNLPQVHKEVKEIARWIKEQLILPQLVVNVLDESTLGRLEDQAAILKVGLTKLEDLRISHGLAPLMRDRTVEAKLVDEDAGLLRTALNWATQYTNKEIKVYNIEDQDAAPLVVPPMTLEVTECQRVVDYLKKEYGIALPHLWARISADHMLTRDRKSWMHMKSDHDITEMDLEFIDRNVPNADRYIVALTVKDNRDVPKLLELPIPAVACCSQRCRTLGAHLQTHWKGTAVRAVKINSSQDVLYHALDANLFESQTNNLYVEWVPSIGSSSTTPSPSVPRMRKDPLLALSLVFSLISLFLAVGLTSSGVLPLSPM